MVDYNLKDIDDKMWKEFKNTINLNSSIRETLIKLIEERIKNGKN